MLVRLKAGKRSAKYGGRRAMPDLVTAAGRAMPELVARAGGAVLVQGSAEFKPMERQNTS